MELREGIIIKTIKYQESSKILYILTTEGVVTGLLRNALSLKSKNYSYSHEGSIIGFDISKSKKNSFDIITSGTVYNRLINVQNNYNKMILMVEIFSYVYDLYSYIENNTHFYDLTKNIIISINENSFEEYDKYYLLIFKLKLLYLLGVGPVFKKCVNCGDINITGFDISLGGALCSKHQTNNKYNHEIISIIEILYLGKIELFSSDVFKVFEKYYHELHNFINEYYNYHLPINTKYSNIIKKIKPL